MKYMVRCYRMSVDNNILYLFLFLYYLERKKGLVGLYMTLFYVRFYLTFITVQRVSQIWASLA